MCIWSTYCSLFFKDNNLFLKINVLILSYLQEWTDSRLDWSSNAAYSSIITMFTTGKYTWFPSLVLLNRLDFQTTIFNPPLSLSLSFLDSQSLSWTEHFPVYHTVTSFKLYRIMTNFFLFHKDLANKMVVITRVVPKLLRQRTKLKICSRQFIIHQEKLVTMNFARRCNVRRPKIPVFASLLTLKHLIR